MTKSLQDALTFLNSLPRVAASGDIAVSSFPSTIDYGALAKLAADHGFGCEADDLRRAFGLFIAARRLAASARQTEQA